MKKLIISIFIILNYWLCLGYDLDNQQYSDKEIVEINKKTSEEYEKKRIKERLSELEEKLKYDLRKEAKTAESIGVVYSIDQIYKNANDFYNTAFNHLIWLISSLVAVLGFIKYKSDSKLEKLEEEMKIFIKKEKDKMEEYISSSKKDIEALKNELSKKNEQLYQEHFSKVKDDFLDEISKVKKGINVSIKRNNILQIKNLEDRKNAIKENYGNELENDFQLNYELGKIDYELKKYADGLSYVLKACELNKTDLDSKILKGKYYYNLKSYDKALKIFEEILTVGYSYNNYTYDWVGKCFFYLKKYDEALGCFKEATEIYNENMEYMNYLGKCYMETGDYPNGIERLEIAVKKDSNKKEFKKDLDDSLYRAGSEACGIENYEEAIEYLEKLCESPQKYEKLNLLLGESFYEINKYENAYEYFIKEEAIPKEKSENYYFYFGKTCYKLKKYKEAIHNCEKFIEKIPENKEIREILGLSYYEIQEYNKALLNLEKVKQNPNILEIINKCKEVRKK